MRNLVGVATAATLCFLPYSAVAQAITLTPADPQPTEAELAPGLAVKYAYPGDVKSLQDAKSWLDYGTEDGEPLVGFDYPDTLEGEMALTSRQSIQVVAAISGYIKFDAPGQYQLEFQSNDGLSVEIGGEEVSRYDGRHPCEAAGFQDVEVPEAGWYELEALYFQRVGTACLLMQWGTADSGLDWTPNEAFAHRR
ncbi:MAG: PA14 domain-containing protein [Pseudomonadota bacterium]